jgi:deoxycytidine triphosphate deaminase
VEGSAFDKLVGRSETGRRIYKTIETSNNTGGTRAVLTAEEREELETRGINPIGIILTLQKIKIMKPETQKLVDQRNQKMVKAMEELQKLPYSQEQRTHQVNQAYKAHNQVNTNRSILETDKK